jgi:hypothetical protein
MRWIFSINLIIPAALIFFNLRIGGDGVQTGSTRHRGHLLSYCACPGWLWGWRIILWNEDWQGKPKYSEKTCPCVTLSTTNPTWPDPGLNPGRRGGKPATNRLSYGAATSRTMVLESTEPLTEMSTRKFPDVKGGRRVGLTTLPPSLNRMSENVGASNSHSPKGLHALYKDSFTFYLHWGHFAQLGVVLRNSVECKMDWNMFMCLQNSPLLLIEKINFVHAIWS